MDPLPTEPLPAVPPVGAPSEPLLTTGTVTALAAAVVAAGVAFGLDFTDAQTGALLTIVAAVAPLIVALVGRTKVFAPATVRAMIVGRGKV